jgi:hypothetical protein
MPSMKMSVPHRLDRDEAARRLKDFIVKMQAQYGSQAKNVKESWNGYTGNFSMEVMGMALSMVLDVEPSEIQMQGEFPFAAMPFKGKIESTVRDKLNELLA